MGFDTKQESVLKLLEGHSKQQDDEFQVIERKAQQVIAVSSLIVAFVGALNLQQIGDITVKRDLLLGIFGVYIITFTLSFLALVPQKWAGLPLNPTWKEAQRVLGKSDEDYFDWLVACYTENIADNEKVLKCKARLVQIAVVVLLIDVLIILIGAVTNAP